MRDKNDSIDNEIKISEANVEGSAQVLTDDTSRSPPPRERWGVSPFCKTWFFGENDFSFMQHADSDLTTQEKLLTIYLFLFSINPSAILPILWCVNPKWV